MKKYIAIVLLVLVLGVNSNDDHSHPTHDDEETPKPSKEEFFRLIEDKEAKSEVIDLSIVKTVFPDRHTKIDKHTYLKLLIGLMMNRGELPSDDMIEKARDSGEAGPDATPGNELEEEQVEWFIFDLMSKYVDSERKDLDEVTLDHVYEDVFDEGIHIFYNKLEQESNDL